MHHGESANPENDENDSEDEEHGNLLSEGLVRALCLNPPGLGERRGTSYESKKAHFALYPKEFWG
jgi:hypothetical protein